MIQRLCSIFSDAGKFCLSQGLRQLTRDVKSDVRTLSFRNDVTYRQEKHRMISEKVVVRRKMSKKKKELMNDY